jgi:hypothetical protein
MLIEEIECWTHMAYQKDAENPVYIYEIKTNIAIITYTNILIPHLFSKVGTFILLIQRIFPLNKKNNIRSRDYYTNFQ